MGRLKQKGKAGAAKAYITRTAAVKKLQCSLADFRRLCILKGIYPREPRSRKKANKGNSAPTSFYYAKDIAYLQHEPVLRKLREHKAFAKKLSRAMGRGEWGIAKGLEERKPVYRLDHIVKERYPTFIDALRDIDDPLCLIALFATLPTNERIPPSLIENCARLYNEWQLYVIHTKSLRKVFLSIKGVYYQAVVQGETITWIVPWMFTQTVPSDVDIRVMLTFLELYQTLLGFVFFKLYTDEGWTYPPPLDVSKEEKGAGIGALAIIEKAITSNTAPEGAPSTLTGKDVRKAIKELRTDASSSQHAPSSTMEVDTAPVEEEEEEFVPQASKSDPNAMQTSVLPTYQTIAAAAGTLNATSRLFEGLSFWLSRETPRSLLEFVIRSFGGKVGWDETVGGGSPYDESWEGITHVIIDRPAVAGKGPSVSGTSMTAGTLDPTEEGKRRKRKYVQPQWVVDCVNAEKLLSEDKYERGKVLPPHLSPFGEEEGAYQPKMDTEDGPHGDAAMKDAEEEESESESGEEIIEGEELPDEEEEEESEAEETKDDKKRKKKEAKALRKAQKDIAAANAEDMRAAELEAEAAGVSYADFERIVKKAVKGKPLTTLQGEDTELAEKDMNKMLMSNKSKRMYESLNRQKRKREEEKHVLEQKRAAIDKAKQKEAKQAKKARVAQK